jgi:hypothetical protein
MSQFVVGRGGGDVEMVVEGGNEVTMIVTMVMLVLVVVMG